jgi:Cdc6-like AAA superfamily ATPase
MCGSLNLPALPSPGTPQCVVFNPYTKDDIVAIIKARLGTSAGKQGSENVCRLQVNAKPGPLLLTRCTLPTFCADP